MKKRGRKSKILVFVMSLMMIFTCTNTSLFAFAGENDVDNSTVQSEEIADNTTDNDTDKTTKEEFGSTEDEEQEVLGEVNPLGWQQGGGPGGSPSGSSTAVRHIDIGVNMTAKLTIGGKLLTQDVTLTTSDASKVNIKAVQSGNSVSFTKTGVSTSTDTSGNGQVRIEGSFPVGTKSNPVVYTVTFTTDVTFIDTSVTPNATYTVPVTFTSTFNYWDTDNVCPGLEFQKTQWQNGSVITGSGMDFVLGTSSATKGVVTITKEVKDEHNGYLNASGQDYIFNITNADGTIIDTVKVAPGTNGIGIGVAYLDYGEYYIEESITDANRTIGDKTYTDTEISSSASETIIEDTNTGEFEISSGAANIEFTVSNYYASENTTSTTPDSPYITVSKTFEGVDEGDTPRGFAIKIGEDTYTLADSNCTANGNTYTWTITDKAAGTYSVSEQNAEFSDGRYILKETAPEGINDSESPVTITTTPAEINSETFTAERHNSCSGGPYKIGDVNYLVASLSGGSYYIIWTEKTLSSTQRDAFIEALGKSSAGGQFGEGNMVSKYHDTPEHFSWYSGAEKNSVIEYKGAKIQFDSNGDLSFSGTRAWKQYVSGLYEFTTGEGADIVIKNTYEKNSTSVSVEKVWNDGNNQDNTRPDSVTVKLYADDTEVEGKTLTLNANNNWQGSFTDLPKYNGNNKIKYTIEEVKVDGYATEVTGSAEDGFTITNTQTVSIPVNKVWEDGNDQDKIRPDSVTVNLYKNGADDDVVASMTLSVENNWTGTFKNLQKYDADGKLIEYTVTEADVEGYAAEITGSVENGFTITNTQTVNIPVNKVWNDGNNQDEMRPEKITVKLHKNGATDAAASMTLSAENNWTGTFENLQKYDADGELIEYTVTEADVEGYAAEITGNAADGFIITNTETIDIPVKKEWYDDNNLDKIRPDSVTVGLYKGKDENKELVKKLLLTEEDNWIGGFNNIPKFAAGTEIAYSVEEIDIPEGYESSVDTEGGITVISNEHFPEKPYIDGEITINKTVVDSSGVEKKINDSFKVIAKYSNSDGPVERAVDITVVDGKGTATITGLPLNEEITLEEKGSAAYIPTFSDGNQSGSEIKVILKEENNKVIVELKNKEKVAPTEEPTDDPNKGNDDSGNNITDDNVKDSDTPDDDEVKDSDVQTGDSTSIMLLMAMMITSIMIGIIILLRARRKEIK